MVSTNSDTILPATEIGQNDIPEESPERKTGESERSIENVNNSSPETDIPEKDIPEKDIPERDIPEPDIPETDIPVTDIPETDIPETDIPEKIHEENIVEPEQSIENLQNSSPETEIGHYDVPEKSPDGTFCEAEGSIENSKQSSQEIVVNQAENTDVRSELSLSASYMSILTRITEISENDLYQNLPFCLLYEEESNSQIFEDLTYNFPPNIDPGIDAYMNNVESDECTGWNRYVKECYKYSLPRLTPVKDVLDLKTGELNLKYYCPQSIGIWLASEELLNQKHIPITHIDLSNSPFTESACHTLGEFLEESTSLIFLSLANCKIGYRGIQILEDGLNYMKCMEELNLSGCQLRDIGGVIVAKAIRNNDTLIKLNLGNNDLYSATGKELGTMLIKNDKLQELELRWNFLYSINDCMVPFLKGLKQNTQLVRLGLAWNGITSLSDFGEYLSKALATHETLEFLDLENNRLSGNAESFIPGFKKSQSLLEVKLGGNPWTPDDIDTLINLFKRKCVVTKMSLGDYKWLTKDQTNLIEKIKKRKKKLEITYQGTLMNNPPIEPNFKNILMDRMKFLAEKPKKAKLKRNMGYFFHKILDEEIEKCTSEEFVVKFKTFRAKVDDGVIQQIAEEFCDPKTKKVYLLDLANYYLERYPTERLPPPPPPPTPLPKKGKKEKGDKKDKAGKKSKKK